MRDILADLVAGGTLSRDDARRAFTIVMRGHAEDAQISALLAIIQKRGVTPDELTGAAMVMREHVTAVPVNETIAPAVIDTCGTGGAAKTFNVSTAAAIVAAGAGAVVAKHGNRSRTGRGSAEVLQRLGVNVDASPQVEARCLHDIGVCFSFAVHHHPAIRFAMPARRALGFPTIFNLLGPLTNPAGASRQLLGVYRTEFTDLIARTLRDLGSRRAMVVHGSDGQDEMAITAPTHVSELHDGHILNYNLDPEKLGFEGRASLDDLQVHSLDDAASCIGDILHNKPGPKLDAAVLNAGAALCVAELAHDLNDGIRQARAAIESGKARKSLDALIECSNEV